MRRNRVDKPRTAAFRKACFSFPSAFCYNSVTLRKLGGVMEVLSQVLALLIFMVMFAVIIMGKVHRFIPALIGAGLTIAIVFLLVMRSPEAVMNTLNLKQLTEAAFWVPADEEVISHGINWQTIIFIAGMMTMVEGLSEVGFFRWLCLYVAKTVHYRVTIIFVAFMLLAGFLAMFIDSITVLLFLAAVTIELARLLKFDPVPVIIAEIFAANTGGSATMSGDPPNIIIGTAFGYTFTDFVLNTGLIAWIGMAVTVGFFYLVFRKSLAAAENNRNTDVNQYPQPREAITSPGLFKINTAIFLLMIVLLVTHAQTGLSVALIGVIVAILTLLTARRKALHLIKRVDWRTLLFFIGLFIAVGGLEETGALKLLADYIGSVAGGNAFIVVTIILWASAFLSAIVDNIPFAATMVPVIASLAQAQGIPLTTLSWALALGTDIGGNATPIGASANVVGTAIADREGYPISWGRFLKPALPAMIIVIGLSWLYLTLRYL
ncbi:MAG: ArsB/NhaD family transporter [Chloroflexi bacterium]|nr:ArsB/NhaD family transporter [Chloroflexota bacterium]